MTKIQRTWIVLAFCLLLVSFSFTVADSRADAGTIVQFSRSAYTAKSGDTSVPITVTLNQPSSMLVNVNFTTLDGTALAGIDYVSKSVTLQIDPHYVQKSISVPLVQPPGSTQSTFIVQLSNPVNASLGTQSSAVVTINKTNATPTPTSTPTSTPTPTATPTPTSTATATPTPTATATATPTPMATFTPSPTATSAPQVRWLYLPLIIRNRPYILTDLLLNPGFEEGYDESHPTYNGEWRNNILTPNDWLAWWEEEDSSILYHMDNPEMLPADITISYYVEPVLRVHSGDWSYKFIRPWGNYNAGFLQVVENLPPGSIAEFSFYAHAWVCDDFHQDALSCEGGEDFWFRAGIDPTGAIDPWSSAIVWSDPYYIFDEFEQVGPIRAAVGSEGKVTVYLAAHTRYPFEINDAYVDTTELVVTVH